MNEGGFRSDISGSDRQKTTLVSVIGARDIKCEQIESTLVQ
jgi:hypothetical protein